MFPTLFRQTGIRPIDSLGREFDRVFGQILNNENGQGLGVYPVDIHEDDSHVYVDAEMPGFSKEEINVTLENGILHLHAQREVKTREGSDQHLNERNFTRIARSFTLPNEVDEDNVEAKLDHGVLHLTLNKRKEVQPRRIEIA